MEKKYPDRNHGKQTKQRLKPYIALQYLLRNTLRNSAFREQFENL